jgi:hypothetical protein
MVLEPASGKRPRALTDFIDEIRVRFVKMKTGQFATLEHVPIELTHNLSIVMPGFVPGIHVSAPQTRRGWPGQARP